MHQTVHHSILFEAGTKLPYNLSTFALFPSKNVSSDNVGCSIINGEAYLNSLEAIYCILPYHF